MDITGSTKTKVFGRAKSNLLNKWFNTTLSDLLRIDGEEQRRRRPTVFVRSALYEGMNRIASDENIPDARVYVYYGKPFSGKSSAGRALLENAEAIFAIKRGLFLTAVAGVPLERTLADLVSAPETGDLEWVTTIFDALAGKTSKNSFTGLSTLMSPFRACGIPGTELQIESKVGYEPPIFVIDNIGDLHQNDGNLIEKIYQLAQSTRVNVFILTDNRTTANDLCRKNGRHRIVPLPGFYNGTPTGNDDVEWVEDPWLIATNSKLVLKVYDVIATSRTHTQQQADGSLVVNFLEDGDLPSTALRKAKDIADSFQIQSSTTQRDKSKQDFLLSRIKNKETEGKKCHYYYLGQKATPTY